MTSFNHNSHLLYRLKNVIHKNTLHKITGYRQSDAATLPRLNNFIALLTIVIAVSCFFMNPDQLIIISVPLNMK